MNLTNQNIMNMRRRTYGTPLSHIIIFLQSFNLYEVSLISQLRISIEKMHLRCLSFVDRYISFVENIDISDSILLRRCKSFVEFEEKNDNPF